MKPRTVVEWAPVYLNALREEEWAGAFEGTPEAQMEALESLHNVMGAVAQGDDITMLCIAEAVHAATKKKRGAILLRLFKENDFVCHTRELQPQRSRQWN